MLKLPKAVKELAELLSNLPTLGPRQATRLAIHLSSKGKDFAPNLSRALLSVGNIKECSLCFNLHEESGNICGICSDKNRDSSTIMVLEKETDLMSMENAGVFGGTYFLLGLVPKTGILEIEQKQRLESLKERLSNLPGNRAKEIILAFNATPHGEFAAELFARELKDLSSKFSRLGRGLPTGGEIEFADADTLAGSLDRRK